MPSEEAREWDRMERPRPRLLNWQNSLPDRLAPLLDECHPLRGDLQAESAGAGRVLAAVVPPDDRARVGDRVLVPGELTRIRADRVEGPADKFPCAVGPLEQDRRLVDDVAGDVVLVGHEGDRVLRRAVEERAVEDARCKAVSAIRHLVPHSGL